MKRFLSALLAAMLVISIAVTSFGAERNDVEKKIESFISYAFDGHYSKNGYTLDSAKNFYILAASGADVSAYTDGFLESVKTAVSAGSVKTLDTLGIAVEAMLCIGENPADFDGCDLTELLKNADPADCSNPYNYLYAIEAALHCGLNDSAKAFADELVKYYKIGSGTDFWNGYGTSCDDISVFLISLSYFEEDYKDYIADAFSLLEEYYSDAGYLSWGDPSSDSTALALAAYSAYSDKENADIAYDLLINNFYDGEKGGITSDYDSYYSTADALFALEYYYPISEYTEKEKPELTTTPVQNSDLVLPEAGNSDVKSSGASKKSPATGAGAGAAVCAMLLSAVAVVSRKLG